jgi:hypothetical protein
VSRRSLFVAGLQSAGVPNDPAATLGQLERQVRALSSMLTPSIASPRGAPRCFDRLMARPTGGPADPSDLNDLQQQVLAANAKIRAEGLPVGQPKRRAVRS